MNNINPLHIGALLGVIILFLFFKLNGVQSEFLEAKKDYKESEKLAVEVSSLKSVYGDKKKIKRELERLLLNSTLKSVHFNIKRSKNSFKLGVKSISAVKLNYLMGKVLNASYNITFLKIKKLSEAKAELEMEIKW